MKLKKGQTGNLRIVKDAGLKLNKKDKSVNNKAGLDGKKKTARGVSKVKCRKPLAVKHVRRLRKAGIAAACIAVAGVTAVGLGFFPQAPVEELSDVEYNTVCFEKPASGNPCDYSVVENVGYLNYVLKNQPYWSSEMQSTVYTVVEQSVNTYKKYYNGVLISADIERGISSKATQFCVSDGVVLWRGSANKEYNGMDTDWSTAAPEGLKVSDFKKRRGLPPSDFSVYVLNENTIKNADERSVEDNGDGTYTMTLDLNVSTGVDGTSADYYYRQQMYVTGGLDKKPEILSTVLTYTFDSDWRVLEYSISDDYNANMVISAHCTSETHTKFYYYEELAKNNYYESYFKEYVNNFTEAETPDNSEPNALNYLAAAFGNVLDEGATFKLNLDVGELGLDGVVHVGLKNGAVEDIRIKLGDISAFMEQNSLYISDGKAKYMLDTSAISLPASDGGSALSLDLNSLMDELTGGEFTVTDGGAKLDTSLELLGLKINLHFTFEVKDGTVSLGDVKAEIPVGNTQVNATLSFGDEGDIPPKPQDISGYTDILKDGITLSAQVKIDSLSLDGLVKIIMSEGEFAGVYAGLDNLTVYYDCPRNMLYLSDGNVNYKFSLNGSDGVDISSILGGLDINSQLKEIINNISTSKDGISTGTTVEILEQTIKAFVEIRLKGGISVGADLEILGHEIKATVGLTNETVTLPNLEEYVDILNEGLTLDVDLTLDGELNLNGLVFIGLEDSKLTEVRADLGDIKVYYINNTLYVTDGNVKYKVAIPEGEGVNLGGLDINGLIKDVINNLTFNESGISTGATLNILEQAITAAINVKLNGGISVGADLELLGHKVNATVGLSNEVVELPDLEEYTDILNEGLTLDVDLTLDETLNLNGLVYIGLEDGKLTEVRADLGDIKVYYINNTLYVTDGNVKYKVAIPEGEGVNLGGLDINGLLKEVIDNLKFNENGISAGVTLNVLEQVIDAAINVKLNGGISVGADIELFGHNIKATVGLTNETVTLPNLEEYTDILNEGLTLDVDLTLDETLNLNGLVYIGLEDGKLTEVRADFGDIKVYYLNNTLYITDGNVKYKVAIPEGEGVNLGGLDINGLLKDIINNLKFNENGISTGVTLNVLEQVIDAAINVKLNGGISVGADLELLGHKVNATVGLTNETVTLPNLEEYTDILNEGLTLDIGLTLDESNAYGDGEINLNGKVFVGLTDGKFSEIRADFGNVAVYYATADRDLYVKVGTTKLKIPLDVIESGEALEISSALPDGTKKIIKELIVNLVAGVKEISTNANFTVLDGVVPVSAKLNFSDGLKAEAQLVLFGVNAKASVGFEKDEIPALSEEQKQEYIDAVENLWGVVESVIGDEISVQADGSIYSYDNAKYAQNGYIKYNFNALLEYSFNSTEYDEEGNEIKKSAVNIDLGNMGDDGVREGMNFWIDSEVYAHFNLELRATSPSDDSLTLDLVLLDANPSATENGVTKGGYTKDKTLDVYLSVSKYTSDNANYDPLMIYAPMDEIMTLVSMAGAMLNLDNISFADNEALTKAVKEIANAIDQLLVNNYLPYTKDQFSSLGDSLIPQILGKDLGTFLEEIMANLGGVSDGDDKANSSFDISKQYIEDISCGNDSLKITLNSSEIYEKQMDKDDYLTVQFIKGENKLQGICLNNVYFGENNVNELDLGLTLDYGEITKPSESDGLKNYRNFDGIDTLLKALVNSATHETEGENAYALNDYFLLNGEVNATINAIGIKVNAKINLNSLAIRIDENNKVSVDAHISYDGVQAAGQVAINGDCDVYLSIKNDMIYLKRIQYTYYSVFGLIATEKTYDTPVVEYRAMPLSAFMDDIMNQLVFLFNFGSLVSKNIENAGDGSGGASFDARDYGNTFKYVLNNYTYEETASEVNCNFAINGKLLTDLVGMTMSDIPVTFKALKNEDGTMTVKGLTVQNSSMQLWGNIVKLEFGASINYCNPNQGKPTANDSSVGVDGLKEISSLSFNDLLGTGSFADIKENVNWNLMKADTGMDYIRYGNNSDLAVALLKVKYPLDGDNENFAYWDREQYVLYNKNTKNIYSYYDTPDLGDIMEKVDGRTAVYKSGFEEENGTLIINAVYDITYKVTVNSKFPVNDSFVFDEEKYVYTVEEAYERVLLPVNVYFDSDGVRYGLKYYTDADGNKREFNEYALNSYGQLCYVAKVDGEKNYTAVWEKVYQAKFVAEFNGSVMEKTVWYYEGQALTDGVLPAVPEIQGYTGVWEIPENTVISPDTEYVFNAKYSVNSYTVTLESGVEVTDGGYILTDGSYKLSTEYIFNESVTLGSLTATTPAYKFMGFYDNPEFAGSPVTHFNVRGDVTYYAKWESKILYVTYSSDMPFGNAKLTDGKYEFGAVQMRYGSEDNLANYSEEGRNLLGWFYEEADGSYTYISSAKALKDKFEYSDETNITLNAVWVEDFTVNVTNCSKSWGTWSIGGNYVGGDYASDLSRQIAEKAGIQRNVQLRYELNDTAGECIDGSAVKDKLNSGKWYELSGNTFSKSSMTTLVLASYGGARIKITYTLNGGELGIFEHSDFKSK